MSADQRLDFHFLVSIIIAGIEQAILPFGFSQHPELDRRTKQAFDFGYAVDAFQVAKLLIVQGRADADLDVGWIGQRPLFIDGIGDEVASADDQANADSAQGDDEDNLHGAAFVLPEIVPDFCE